MNFHRFAARLEKLAADVASPLSPNRDVVVARMRSILSDMDVVKRAGLVTETDFHDAFSSLPMKDVQKLYDGPLMFGDRPAMNDLWGQFTYARNQISDESPEKDPEFDHWVSVLRAMMETMSL